MPVHFSRYHPDYRLAEPPTSVHTLLRAREIARGRLNYVYLGNLWPTEGENTDCPGCGKTVIARQGFAVTARSVVEGKCGFCGHGIPIVGT
jgi:pyruvate formate lyase activating enzyme